MIQNLGVHCSYMWSTFMVVIRSSQLDVFTVYNNIPSFFSFQTTYIQKQIVFLMKNMARFTKT